MSREDDVALIKQTALDLGRRVVLTYLAAQVPIFANYFLRWLADLIISKVLSVAINQTEFGVFFLYVDLRVNSQGKSFEEAARAWFNAKPEEKAKYEKDYLDKFYAIAKLTN